MFNHHQQQTTVSAVATLLLLASILITTTVITTFTSASQPCSSPLIPDDLSLQTKVAEGDSRGIHLQGIYSVLNAEDKYSTDPAVQSMVHSTIISQPSDSNFNDKKWFRMSVSPNLYDTKLFLYDISDDSSAKLVQSSVSGGGKVEQMLFYVLQPGKKYRVLIAYNLGWQSLKAGCPALILELAIQSYKDVPHFSDACINEEAPKIGDIDPQKASKTDKELYFKFNQESPAFASIGGSSSSSSSSWRNDAPFDVVASYDVVVPHLPGRHQKWKFRSAIHANFIDGGDLSLILLNANFTSLTGVDTVTPDSCAEDKFDCAYAHRSLKNTAILQEELMAGNDGRSNQYRLFLVRRRRESQIDKTCFPYSMSVDLFPLPSQDTFINCEAEPLIKSLNAPGLYNNNTGVLRYKVPVLVNLTDRIQKARFTTTKTKSIMRAWISAHRTVDADIYLWQYGTSTAPIAYSMSSYQPDGFVAQLEGNKEYVFEVALATTHKKDEGIVDLDYSQLCDFFELQIHVFPVADSVEHSNEESSCTTNPPDFASIVAGVKSILSSNTKVPIYEVGHTSYNKWPYSYKIDRSKPIQQEVIESFILDLPRAALIALTLSADSYHGTPIVELRLANGDPTDILYSRHRSIGSYMFADLERGQYNVTILTPYTQHEYRKTWATDLPDVPTCVKYNFHLSLGESNECVGALPAPHTLRHPGPTHHHHIGDVFRIKPFITEHNIIIRVKTDSVVHFQSDEATADLSVSLIDQQTQNVVQKATIVSSRHQQHGKVVELFAGIASDRNYVLQLKFDDGTSTSNMDFCRRFAMELSIAPVPPTPQVGSVDYQCDEATGVQDFGTLILPADANEIDVWKPNQLKGAYIAQFKIDEAAHIRMTMKYDFTEDAPSLMLCPCTSPHEHWCAVDCITADVFINGLEIPTTTLLAGTYSAVISGWEHGVGSEIAGDTAKITTMCHRFALHMSLEPFRSLPSPAMCPSRMQHLPRDLNDVGMLSPYYNNQLHFLQELKLSAKKGGDKTVFRIEKDTSIIRFQIGYNDFSLNADLRKKEANGKFTNVDYAYEGSAIYAVVQPGTYELAVDYVFMNRGKDALIKDGCVAVPFEIAIIPASDLQKLSTQSDSCQETPAFPTEMNAHSSLVMMYRSPSGLLQNSEFAKRRYDKKIDFAITGDIGAFVNANLLFNFETGGLEMTLMGSEMNADGSYALNRTFPVVRTPNRATVDVYLQKGRYTLHIWDPVNPDHYKNAQTANVPTCTRFSLGLSNSEYGSSNTNQPGVPPVRPPNAPTNPSQDINCNYLRYDFLPASLTADNGNNNDVTEWSTISGDSFRIPFEAAIDKQQTIGSEVVTYKVIEVPINFKVNPGQYIRVWFRTRTTGVTSMDIVDPDAGETAMPIATGKWFGRNTLSISLLPYQPMDSLQLKIKIVYMDLPVYGTDYKTCAEKRNMDTFELLFSRFPISHLTSMVTCPKEASSKSVLPQTSVTTSTTLHGEYYITGDDIKTYLKDRNRYDEDGANGIGFSVLPTFEHKIDITLNDDNMYIMLFADYNLLISDFRAYFLFSNGTALRNNDGNPIGGVDEKYDATLFIHASRLPRGTYSIVIVQANAESRLKKEAQYCIPFDGEIIVGGGNSYNHHHNIDKNTALVTALGPITSFTIDASEALLVTATLNQDADINSLPSSIYDRKNIAWMEDDKGNKIYSASMYFWGTRELRILFAGATLAWNVEYKFVLDASRIKTASTPVQKFRIDPRIPESSPDGHLITYRTATCGCTEATTCALGGGCPCTEPSGVQCFTCEDNSFLSNNSYPVGLFGVSSPKQIMQRICEMKRGGGWHPTQAPVTYIPPTPNEKTNAPDPHNKNTGVYTNTTDSDHQVPPLRFLRRFLAYVALLGLFVYVCVLLFNYRKQLQQHANNPFRMLSSMGDDEMGDASSNNNNINTVPSAVASSPHGDSGMMDMDDDMGNAVHEAAQ